MNPINYMRLKPKQKRKVKNRFKERTKKSSIDYSDQIASSHIQLKVENICLSSLK